MNTVNKILSSKIHNPHYLNKYITFISNCQKQNESYTGYTERHHICPKADDMFPEFTSFANNPWNCAKLTPRQHYIAHWMLYKTFNTLSTRYAFVIMKKRLHKETINKNKVVVKNSEGVILQVDKTDPRYLSGDLVSINKGMVIVRDKEGGIHRISTSSSLYQDKILLHINTGKTIVKDVQGNNIQISTDEYKTGNFTHVNKGKITVRDSDGRTSQASITDPRVVSGQLVSIAKGMIVTKDKVGTIYRVSVTDERYLSGELLPVATGVISKKRKLTNEQIKEMRLALISPEEVISNEFLYTIVRIADHSKISSHPIHELRGGNNRKLNYILLLSRFYADKYNMNVDTIKSILENKTYREVV